MFLNAEGEQQSRIDSYSVRNSVLIISHTGLWRMHIFTTTFLETAVYILRNRLQEYQKLVMSTQ